MAKGNDFKKPVNNNQELIINDDEEKNKKLMIIVCLSIFIVLGLIIVSINYFNSNEVEDSKKNKGKDNEKTNDVINKPIVDEKPVNDVVVTVPEEVPSYKAPSKPIVVVPSEPDEPVVEETPVISSDVNDYAITMEGNKAIVSGVSRYVAKSNVPGQGSSYTNFIRVKVLLNSNYSLDYLSKLDSFNVSTNTVHSQNNFSYNDLDLKYDENNNLYFYWDQAVGNGTPRVPKLTITYENGITEVYTMDLSGLSIESEVTDAERDLVKVPDANTDSVNAFGGLNFTYDVEIYRQLTEEEIEWLESEENPSVPALAIEDDSNNDTTDTSISEPDYSKDLTYTVKFEKNGEYIAVDSTLTDKFNGTVVEGYKDVIVVKVYAPAALSDEELKNFTMTATKPDGDTWTYDSSYVSSSDDNSSHWIYLMYAIDRDRVSNLNPKFVIDWDGEGTKFGKITYEFNLSELVKEDEVEEPTEPEEGDNNTPTQGETVTESEETETPETDVTDGEEEPVVLDQELDTIDNTPLELPEEEVILDEGILD